MSVGVYTSHIGNNDALFSHVARMFLKKGDRVADITYGKGVFWKKLDTSMYDFHGSDLVTCPNAPYDFRCLPYTDGSFDVVVFDPPYTHNPGRLIVNDSYKNVETTKGMYHDDIIDLYRQGMMESIRILKEGGTLWVKCKDEVESSIQRWSHVEIFLVASSLGLYAVDFFILTQKSKPVIQHKEQKHSRKNHSYLWILMKTGRKDNRLLVQRKAAKEASCRHKKS
jgi:DNA modification methylase